MTKFLKGVKLILKGGKNVKKKKILSVEAEKLLYAQPDLVSSLQTKAQIMEEWKEVKEKIKKIAKRDKRNFSNTVLILLQKQIETELGEK